MEKKDKRIIVIKHTANSKKGTTVAFNDPREFVFSDHRDTVQVTVDARTGGGYCEIIIPIEVLERMLAFGLDNLSKSRKQHGLFENH